MFRPLHYDIEDGLYILTYQYLDRLDWIAQKFYIEEETIKNMQGHIWEVLQDRFNASYEYREKDIDDTKWYAIVFKTKEEVELAIEYLHSFDIMNKLRGDL